MPSLDEYDMRRKQAGGKRHMSKNNAGQGRERQSLK